MNCLRLALLIAFLLTVLNAVRAQNVNTQQGLVYKSGTSERLGSVQILNKRSLATARSNSVGVFSISAISGDTLSFTSDNCQSANLVISNFADKIIYLNPVIQLDEVLVKEYSVKSEIAEVQRGYREKSVFYTGTPHYYYLFLKPMTFIYENFKSEVKDARRFNRFARKELASYQITSRFNNSTIKKAISINDADIERFELLYQPTLQQINAWNDYELINYIRASYESFKNNKGNLNYLDL